MRIQAGWNFRKGQVFGTHRDVAHRSQSAVILRPAARPLLPWQYEAVKLSALSSCYYVRETAEMWGKMRAALSRCCRPNQNVCASGRSARNAAQNSKPFALAVAAAFVLIGLALTSDAEAQTLGGTEPFAVLGNETVTNTDPTVLTGDLGVYDGTAITGFFGTVENDGPGIVNGAIHQTDAVAQAAQADANTLFTVLM